jgi:ubiquinone/menaquinone biosynthesis C-methylase UbiE
MLAAITLRIAPSLVCPGCGHVGLVGDDLRCTSCGLAITQRQGWLDFDGGSAEPTLSPGQRFFMTPTGGRFYEALRERSASAVVTGKTAAQERRFFEHALPLDRRATVLDVPAGQGNFTERLARRVPDGVVVGVDLSPAMLDLAAARLRRAGVSNVVLVRASALALPLADRSMDAVSTCGGLHLYPDVPQAIAEMARVLAPNGPIAGLTFQTPAQLRWAAPWVRRATGMNALEMNSLAESFRAAGFEAWSAEGSALVGYFAAARRA